MYRNKEQRLNRQSKFNENRTSYLDSNFNYVYEYQKLQDNGSYVTKRCVIPYSEENCNIFIMLDGKDHDFDLGERYDEENADVGFRAKQSAYENGGGNDGDDDFRDAPIDCIADQKADIFSTLFPEEESTDPRIKEITEWMKTLTEPQRDLIYKHLGMGMSLEDIRREEETLTGRTITKQAMHNRWDKILNRACKHFGIEKPKQTHKA